MHKTQNFNRHIEHAIIATVLNNRFIRKYALDIRPEKQNSVINSSKVYQNIFEAIKQMNETTSIISQDNIHITNSNTFSTAKEHNNAFPDQRLCKITKRMYISFTLEPEFNLSQMKYTSKYNSTKWNYQNTPRAYRNSLKSQNTITEKKQASDSF